MENHQVSNKVNKIFDCFMYEGENEVLRLRLRVLNKIVDYFIISESTIGPYGLDKTLSFDLELFSEFKDKIIYLKFTPDREKSVFERENQVRDHLIEGLYNAANNDIIIISDV